MGLIKNIENEIGINWGNLVIGEEKNGKIEFNLIGNYLPNTEVDSEVSPEDMGKERKYLVTTKNQFFTNNMLKFVNKCSHKINQLLEEKKDDEITNFMNEIAGKNTELTDDEEQKINEFQKYLKYRIILNKDFRFCRNKW